MVHNPPGHYWEASPDLAVCTINRDAHPRRTVQWRKNKFEYAKECVGIYQSLEFVGPRGLCELGWNGQ